MSVDLTKSVNRKVPTTRGPSFFAVARRLGRSLDAISNQHTEDSRQLPGKSGVRHHPTPKPDEVVRVVRGVVVPASRTRVVGEVEPRAATQASGPWRFRILASIVRFVRVGLVDASRPLPHVARHVERVTRALAVEIDPNRRRRPDLALRRVRAAGIPLVAPGPLATVGAARRLLPLRLARACDDL